MSGETKAMIYIGERKDENGKPRSAFLKPDALSDPRALRGDAFSYFPSFKLKHGIIGGIYHFPLAEDGKVVMSPTLAGHHDNPDHIAAWVVAVRVENQAADIERAAKIAARSLDRKIDDLLRVMDTFGPLDKPKAKLYVLSRLMK